MILSKNIKPKFIDTNAENKPDQDRIMQSEQILNKNAFESNANHPRKSTSPRK